MENTMIIENVLDNAALNEALTNLAEVCQKLDVSFHAPDGAKEEIQRILGKFIQKWGYLANASKSQLTNIPLSLAGECKQLVEDVCEALGLHWSNRAVSELSHFVWDVVGAGIQSLFMEDEQRFIDTALRAANQLPVYLQEVVDEINKL